MAKIKHRSEATQTLKKTVEMTCWKKLGEPKLRGVSIKNEYEPS